MEYGGIDDVVAHNIREAVKASGMSERQVSNAAGIPDPTWDRVVRKGVGSLRVPQFLRVAHVLGIKPGDLLPEDVAA